VRRYVLYMKRIFYLILAGPTIAFCLLTSCADSKEGSPSISKVTNAPSHAVSAEPTNQAKAEAERSAALDEALAYAAKQREDRMRGVPLPPSQFPFPNVEGRPLHPRPDYVNFYRMNDPYPDYLLCEYDIDAKTYNQSEEPKWFEEAIKQSRRSGSAKFPPIKWIAVIICNKAEWKDANTMDQVFRTGAIFKASDVFDSSRDVSQLIAHADMDRHPFFLDLKRPELLPAEQQRWMIVERHAAATGIPASGKK
jgi:hypothetical protein